MAAWAGRIADVEGDGADLIAVPLDEVVDLLRLAAVAASWWPAARTASASSRPRLRELLVTSRDFGHCGPLFSRFVGSLVASAESAMAGSSRARRLGCPERSLTRL